MTERTIGAVGSGALGADALDAFAGAETEPEAGVHGVRLTNAEDARRREVRAEVEELLAMLAAGNVSPEAILGVCSRRLDDLDGQIAAIMGEIEDATATSDRIADELAALRELQEQARANETAGRGWNDPMPGPEFSLTPEHIREWMRRQGIEDLSLENMGRTLHAAGLSGTAVQDALENGGHYVLTCERARQMMQAAGMSAEDVENLIQRCTPGATRNPPGEMECVFFGDDIRAWLRAAGTSDSLIDRTMGGLRGAASASFSTYARLVMGPTVVDAASLQARIDGLNEDLREANSGSEMRMIRLQTVMQQRTALIQMTSNLLKSLDEGTDTAVGNLR
jgi:hypothetical protein